MNLRARSVTKAIIAALTLTLFSCPPIHLPPTTSEKPIAKAGADISGITTGSAINLDGSASKNAESYTWSIEEKPVGSNASIDKPNLAKTTFTPDLAGAYTIKLTVSNKLHKSSDSLIVTAKTPSYTLTYQSADETMGTIEGKATQTVEQGKDAETVIAKPKAGYQFVKWNDDITTPTRTDTNIHADADLIAHFKEVEQLGTAEIAIRFEGPTDEVINLTDPGKELRINLNEKLHVLFESSFSSIEWELDGNKVSGQNGPEFLVYARELSVNIHTLVAWVTINGRLYSKQLRFSVSF